MVEGVNPNFSVAALSAGISGALYAFPPGGWWDPTQSVSWDLVLGQFTIYELRPQINFFCGSEDHLFLQNPMRLLLSLVLAACLVPAAPRELPVVEEVDIQEVDIQEVVVEGFGSDGARVEVEQLDQVGSLA